MRTASKGHKKNQISFISRNISRDNLSKNSKSYCKEQAVAEYGYDFKGIIPPDSASSQFRYYNAGGSVLNISYDDKKDDASVGFD